MKTSQKIIAVLAASISSFAIAPMAASAAPDRVSGCRTYSTGRITCSYSTGAGSYSYNSYNPYSGYSSNGYRNSYGSSSYGYNNYSSRNSYGYRSYSSYGLGSGNSSRNSWGWNSNRGYWSFP